MTVHNVCDSVAPRSFPIVVQTTDEAKEQARGKETAEDFEYYAYRFLSVAWQRGFSGERGTRFGRVGACWSESGYDGGMGGKGGFCGGTSRIWDGMMALGDRGLVVVYGELGGCRRGRRMGLGVCRRCGAGWCCGGAVLG